MQVVIRMKILHYTRCGPQVNAMTTIDTSRGRVRHPATMQHFAHDDSPSCSPSISEHQSSMSFPPQPLIPHTTATPPVNKHIQSTYSTIKMPSWRYSLRRCSYGSGCRRSGAISRYNPNPPVDHVCTSQCIPNCPNSTLDLRIPQEVLVIAIDVMPSYVGWVLPSDAKHQSLPSTRGDP